MSQSLAKIYVHIIFSTKHRQPIIQDDIEKELFAYIGGIIKAKGEEIIGVNGTSDHIHILCTLPKTMSLSKYIQQIKANSSKRIKEKDDTYQSFTRQTGYASFSVSQSQVEAVKKYIANQKQHHHKQTFQDELKEFLEKYQTSYDEKYLRD